MSADAPLSASGGTGGKFPKRPHSRRATSTPYTRPHDTPDGSRRWVPKVFDPALKLFSSVFRSPPPENGAPPPVDPQEMITPRPIEVVKNINLVNALSFKDPQGVKEGETSKGDLASNEVSQIEHILKQKTFTRDELDKLTELLRSRTTDLVPENENVKVEPSMCKPMEQVNKRENTIFMDQDQMKSSKLFERTLKRNTIRNASEVEIASPTELAKAYMGSRGSSSSVPSTFRCLSFGDIEVSPCSSLLFQPKSVDGAVVPRYVIRFSKLLEKGHRTVYKLPESQFRDCSFIFNQGVDRSMEAYSGFSSFGMDLPEGSLSARKLNLKRRSSVLDGDSGSVDPIRHTRQKSCLLTPVKEFKSSHSRGCLYTPSTSRVNGSADSTRQSLLLGSARCKNTMVEQAEVMDEKPPCLNLVSVPQQSSLMAKKILQQLDQLVPSPKEKCPELTSGGMELSLSNLSANRFQNGMLASPKDRVLVNLLNLDDNKSLDNITCGHDNIMNGTSGASLEVNPLGLASSAKTWNNPSILKKVPESSLELHADCQTGEVFGGIFAERRNSGNSVGKVMPHSSLRLLQKSPILSVYDSIRKTNKVQEETPIASVSFQISSEQCSIPSIYNQHDLLKEESIPIFKFGSKKVCGLIFSKVASDCSSSGLKFGTEPESKYETPKSGSLETGDELASEECPVFIFGGGASSHLRDDVRKSVASSLSFSQIPMGTNMRPSSGSSTACSSVATSAGLFTRGNRMAFGSSPSISSISTSSIPSQFSYQGNIFGLIPTSSSAHSSTSLQFGLQAAQVAGGATAFVQSSLSQSISASPVPVPSSPSIFAMSFTSAPSNVESVPVFGKQPTAATSSGPHQVNFEVCKPPSGDFTPAASSFGSPIPATRDTIFRFESQPVQPSPQIHTTGGGFSIGSQWRQEFFNVGRDKTKNQ